MMKVEEQHLTKKQKRHREFYDRLDRFNRDFAEKKERVYVDKLTRFRREIAEIQQGTHQEFRDRVSLLEMERERAIMLARSFSEYQWDCASNAYRSEAEAAQQEYEAERRLLLEKVLSGIEERRKRLREDRESTDFSSEPDPKVGIRKGPKRDAQRVPDGKDKKRSKIPLITSLKESEMMEDLLVLRSTRPTYR
ncbi:Sds3-like-domain-containing protein [Zopfochytrium polystomum]|nr:Sds3-like-domain-containing protein [Zopfochytrium polystomum]